MCHECENCGNCVSRDGDTCGVLGIKIGANRRDYDSGYERYEYSVKCNLYEHDGGIRPLVCPEAWKSAQGYIDELLDEVIGEMEGGSHESK